MKKFFFLMALLLISSGFFAGCTEFDNEEDTTPELSSAVIARLDRIIDSTISADNLPGVAVGIWIPEEGEYLKTFGKANIALGLNRQFEDPFRIASITKTFTATVVLTLVDDGLLKTTDKLSKYLPSFPNSDNITIKNLLQMRSGIAEYADAATLQEWYNNPGKSYTLDYLISLSAARSSEFTTPGVKTQYCNSNYTILAKVAEIVSGESFAELMQQRVINPLGLSFTKYPVDGNTEVSGYNRGYSWQSVTTSFSDKTELNTTCANAGGAMISNMWDLATFARVLYNGTLLSKATQQERMETWGFDGKPGYVRYGEGIMQLSNFYGHNGTIFGFSTEMFYLPSKDAVIVINVNRLDLDDQSKSSSLFFAISKALFPTEVSW